MSIQSLYEPSEVITGAHDSKSVAPKIGEPVDEVFLKSGQICSRVQSSAPWSLQ
jgi:hypothetical protein